MKALAKIKPETGLWMVDVEHPKVGHNDVLIKIKKTAICGTDIHIYNWDHWASQTIPLPMHVGHEYVVRLLKLVVKFRGLTWVIGCLVKGI